MVISEDIYAMLLVETFFKTFTKKISYTKKSTEVFVALSSKSKSKVDEMISNALGAGAREARGTQDRGFMCSRIFEDLDRHI